MQVIRFVGVVSLLLACSNALADVQFAQGQASLSYNGKSVPPAVRTQAIQAAELKAIASYYATAGSSDSANFDRIKERVAANLDQYVLDQTIIEEQDRKDVHEYTVSLRAKLNVSELDNAIKAASGVAAPNAVRSPITLLVVARQASSKTDFDPHTYQRVDVNSKSAAAAALSEKTTEGESISKGQVNTNGSKSVSGAAEASSSVSVERGGSTERKASVTRFTIYPGSDLDQVLNGAFHQAGFRVKAAADVEAYSGGKLHLTAVQKDYTSDKDLKPQTLLDVETGVRNAKIPYVTLGTLDVGFADQSPDPATGLVRVPVEVNIKVLDLGDTIPDTVASVGPVTYSGLGHTEEEAQVNGLKLAAQKAAKELISQLDNAGVH